MQGGGAAEGYRRAGFTEIVGVDIEKQARYPFEFIGGDALMLNIDWVREFDAIHASPPCQRYSVQTKQHGTTDNHPDLVSATRALLKASGKPYVIENVVGAPLLSPILLCGSMFGLTRLRRHRLFESNVALMGMSCNHDIQHDCISVAGHAGGKSTRDGADRFGGTELWRELMGCAWMTGNELAEAIPPIYTEYIGRQIIQASGKE